MNNSLIPIIQELERVYDCLSKEFNLPSKPIITIQSKGRQKGTLGWYWDKKWKIAKKDIGEINICAESLNKNPIETLVHEIAHYTNAQDKIIDCNNQNYHNKKFKERAENYGLNVKKSGRHGWSYTNISPKLEDLLKKIKINLKVFELYRKQQSKTILPTKMKKYNCKCTIVRCATKLKAKCLICNAKFEKERVNNEI